MSKYRKKPVVIEAVQVDGTEAVNQRIIEWTRESKTPAAMVRWHTDLEDGSRLVDTHPKLTIKTLRGPMAADVGDWIIKSIGGEFYPCKPDIFEQTYEAVDV